MDDAYEMLRGFWQQAGAQDMPVIVAAFLSNSLLAMVSESLLRIPFLDQRIEPPALMDQLEIVQRTSQRGGQELACMCSGGILTVMDGPWKSLLALRSTISNTSENDNKAAPTSETTSIKLLENIRQHIDQCYGATSVARLGSPLLFETSQFLTSAEGCPHSFFCGLGVTLLLESSQIY